jgi:hypothetical protein
MACVEVDASCGSDFNDGVLNVLLALPAVGRTASKVSRLMICLETPLAEILRQAGMWQIPMQRWTAGELLESKNDSKYRNLS